jgi:hypothetical protein
LCALGTSMPVMAHTTRRVTYRGNPEGAPMLARMFEQEGVRVKWKRPQEQPDMAGMAQEVIVNMVTSGSLLAIRVALDKFRKHMHATAEATIEDDGQDDDLQD